jgi:Cu-Zn family superoxide dismutase
MLPILLRRFLVGAIFISVSPFVMAKQTVSVNMTADSGVGPSVGTVYFQETQYGLLIIPHLHDLPPGLHGFHVHQHSSCAQKGMAAGDHLDPRLTKKHLGPYAQGHLGDLPVLYVEADGTATTPVLAPRIKRITDLSHHALMIHAGGDNYADLPEKNGGGGARIACGVID